MKREDSEKVDQRERIRESERESNRVCEWESVCVKEREREGEI